jgi:metal-responsive CopG/Arc/MetJ family transcriptional regulator
MRGVISLRIESSLLEELDKAVQEEGRSRTGIIKEAIRYYLQHLRKRKDSEGFVPFIEFKKANEELKSALERIAELEARVAELRKENEMLKASSAQKKRRWFF